MDITSKQTKERNNVTYVLFSFGAINQNTVDAATTVKNTPTTV